jgi:hypothetical protein
MMPTGVFALDDVRDAFRQLELRHTRGKLVLRPWTNEASFVTWVRLR